MLPPKGKNKAASIWSVDSGYASNTLDEEDASYMNFVTSPAISKPLSSSSQKSFNLEFGDFFKVHVEDQLRLPKPDSPSAPVTTKLNVYTTNVRASHDLQSHAAGVNDECVLCALWDITNPGENLKCDKCSQNPTAKFGATGSSGLLQSSEAKQESMHIVTQVEKFSALQLHNLPNKAEEGQHSTCSISDSTVYDQTTTPSSYSPDIGTSFPGSLNVARQAKRSSIQRPPTKLESHALRRLKFWLRDNSSNPYPDADTKHALAQECGITEKQVNTWFTNARARQRFLRHAESSHPHSREERDPTNRFSKVKVPQTPEGYRILEEIHRSDHKYDPERPKASRRGKKKDYSHLSTLSPVAKVIPTMSCAQAQATTKVKGSTPNMWQCTFCYQIVAPKSWRRHEETQHRPKRKWTCLHTGPSFDTSYYPTSSTLCVFCMLKNPSKEHLLHSHRISECIAKAEEDRTFLRPDHLRQHVKNFHQSSLVDAVRDLWRTDGVRKDGPEIWTCGFCALEMTAWDARQTHIAAHFKDGLTMADWKSHPQPEKTTHTSKKRPMSSEGRPKMFSKLARNFAGLSARQERQDMSQSEFVSTFESTTEYVQPGVPVAPLLPDLTFDNFPTAVYSSEFNFGSASMTDSSEEETASKDSDTLCPVGDHDLWLNYEDSGSLSCKDEYDNFLDFW
ncbi:hypothetical protein J3E72DRAFT_246262 [Bipolaris maydis]|nr:hypothetical protein J3E73DRAFT_217318 [Bipolaris maydis]KAJ6195333.1 hypothetical protein J3E72DRAFT_246262 [Bipolaris maydis]KAJ6279643.1 hypothetical protein J3E71DRAFT_201050 [Bipolaris maydis]